MSGKKILIVDDELIGRQLLEAVLIPESYINQFNERLGKANINGLTVKVLFQR